MPRRLDHPALRPGVAAIPMAGAILLRLGDEEIHVLSTDVPERVLALLQRIDGRSRAALDEGLDGDEQALLAELLAELGRANLLAAVAVPEHDEVARCLSHSGVTADRLRAGRARVVGHPPAAELLVRILGEHGLPAEHTARAALADPPPQQTARGDVPPPAIAGVIACVCERPDLALLYAVNEAACRAAVPCLFVDLSHGRHATVGPFFVPGDGACFECVRTRIQENTAAYDELVAAERHMLSSGRPLPGYGLLPAHRHMVLGLAAAEIVAFFAEHRPLRTLSRILTIALDEARIASEPAYRVPWCRRCGALDRPERP